MDSINRRLILSDNEIADGHGGSPEFKFRNRRDEGDMRGQDSRKRGKATDSLQDLLKNTKFEITGDQDGFIGEGISPDKKYKGYKTQAAVAPGASSPEDFET